MNSFEVTLSVEEKGKKRPEYTLDTDLNGEITLQDLLQWTKSALIITADEVLREEQANGFDKEPILLVDGRQGRNPNTVNPLGQIEFVSRSNVADIFIETYEGLLKRSPVLKGDYKASHYVAYNGTQVASSLEGLKSWLAGDINFKAGDTIRIVNVQPYARRLELLGVTAQRTQNRREDAGRRAKKKTGTMVRVPNGAYQLTSRSIKSKYKNNVGVRFSFLPGTSIGLSGSFKGGRKGRNSSGRPYLYPSIAFVLNERGMF